MRVPRLTRMTFVRGLAGLSGAMVLGVGAPALFMNVATGPPAAFQLPEADPAAVTTVRVVAWGYHSSIFIEQFPGWRLGPEGNEDAPFVEYGWGDRSFFMQSDYCPMALFNAAFVPTPTVVYVRGHDSPPEQWVAGQVFFRECPAVEVLRLVRVLEGQFDRRADGSRPVAYPPAAGYEGRFYPGREYYVIWWNCNEWTVRMLRDAGMASSAAFVGWPGQVGGRLDGFREAPSS